MARPIIFFLFLIIVLASCTVKKRAYRSGYYIEWNKHTNHTSSSSVLKHKKESLRTQTSERGDRITESEVLVSSDERLVHAPTTKRPTIFANPDSCDVITMKNGDEIKAKVLEISSTEIKYKQYDNLEGPLVTVKKSDVFSIKYANGTKEIIKDEKPANPSKPVNKEQPKPGDQEPKVHPLAIASILLSTVGIFLLGVGPIIGIIMGSNALREITREPLRYTGKGLAIAGIVIGAIWVILAVIWLLIILALLFSLI